MQYICNTYLSETFHVKHFVNTDTELQPIMVKKERKISASFAFLVVV